MKLFFPSATFKKLLRQARGGCRQALGALLEPFLPRLLDAAESNIGPRLQSKFRRSDLVQQTCAEAQTDLRRFKGTTEEECLPG